MVAEFEPDRQDRYVDGSEDAVEGRAEGLRDMLRLRRRLGELAAEVGEDELDDLASRLGVAPDDLRRWRDVVEGRERVEDRAVREEVAVEVRVPIAVPVFEGEEPTPDLVEARAAEWVMDNLPSDIPFHIEQHQSAGVE
jgi:hypothetical protein